MSSPRRRLGSSDLQVHPLCLGGNTFGWTTDSDASFAVLDAYAAAGGNFIDTMFRVAAEKPEVRVVDDEVLTPTFTRDLAAQIRLLALEGPPGLYHVTAGGACSWYEFARAIFELGGLKTPLGPTSSNGAQGVRRPSYSVLDNAALARLGLDRMRPWREALADYMQLRQ